MARRLAAYKENDDYRVSTGTADTEMGSTAAGRALPPQCARTAAGREGTTQAIETQYPVLPPIKYIQRSTWIWPPSLRVGGPGLGARTSVPPQFLSESSPMGSCLRVSDFRLYCYFLKKQKRKHTLLFLNVFLAATCVEKNSLNCFSDWSGSAFKQWNKLGKPYAWSHRDMTRN